jgi:amino acid adenylation domain-containing protein
MVIGIMGILKAGAAYVPMDPSFPRERLSFMLEDAKARVLLTQKQTTLLLPDQTVRRIFIDADTDAGTVEEISNPVVSVDPDNLAYVMYTSGSTGKPKGVMISHRNVAGFLYSYKKVTLDGQRRIGTSVAPFSFDTSVEEIFSNLCFGGSLHIVRPENSIDAGYFAKYLADHHINTTYILPDLLADVAGHLEKLKDRLNLKCLMTGLAPKKQSVLQLIREILPETMIVNAYGPTEVTYGATAFAFHSADHPDRDVPIGKPFPNYEVYIVDANLQPVPIGVSGELLIGGVGLARGYLNRPELTAEKFIFHPFSKEPGARLYRTGDLGSYLPDGNVEFLGRIDNQVKIRGYRIEPGEIESVLNFHPEIIRAVIVAREDHPGNKRLIAYIVLRDRQFPISELSRFLEGKLPSYMIPTSFVMLDELPLMPNGKLDRGALPPPDYSKGISEEYYLPPRTATEKSVAGTWSELLGIKTIGIHDNFFEMGGHSLLATQVVSRLNKTYNISIPLRSFFEVPTISGLASLIQDICWQIQGRDLVGNKSDEFMRGEL